MIKTLSACVAVMMLAYIGFIGHYYYQTFSNFSAIEQAQQQTGH